MARKQPGAGAARPRQPAQPMLDAFEWKARLAPAILSLLPLLPLSAAYGGPLPNWLGALAAATGLAAVAAVGLAYLAAMAGTLYQRRLWPDWPYDSPANRGLRPGDTTRSEAERKELYAALLRLTRLDIGKAAEAGDPADVDAVIEAALSRIRFRLANDAGPLGRRTQLHLTDYAFARNLAGLWPAWISASGASLVGCWVRALATGLPGWAFAATAVFIALIVLALCGLKPLVRHRADVYARTLHNAILDYPAATGQQAEALA